VVDAGVGLVPGVLPPSTVGLPGVRCRGSRDLRLDRRPADVLILFDRSSSMGTALASGTRYTTEAALLTDLTSAFEDKLRLALAHFPARGSCDGHTPGCCVATGTVAPDYGQADAIADAVAAAAPVAGATPTAEALRLARRSFERLEDGVSDRYVILSTDGRPSCGADGRLATADLFDATGGRAAGGCFDALAEVDALVAAGVQVLVLAVGDDDAPAATSSCLDELARHGGHPRAPGPPSLYSLATANDLELALLQMFGAPGPASCQLELDKAPTDPDRMAVFLDGREIPRDGAQGWSYLPDDLRHILINGDDCRRVQRYQVTRIDIRGACTPCPQEGEGASCD